MEEQPHVTVHSTGSSLEPENTRTSTTQVWRVFTTQFTFAELALWNRTVGQHKHQRSAWEIWSHYSRGVSPSCRWSATLLTYAVCN